MTGTNNLDIIRNLTKGINASLIRTKFQYKRWRFKPLLVLTYHQISSVFNPEIDIEAIWTSIDDFNKTVLFLRKIGYNFISLKEALSITEMESNRDKHYAVITFDDGYSSILNILPYLEYNEIPATFFINTAYLDDRKKNWIDISNYLQKNTPDQELDDDIKIALTKLNSTDNSDIFETNKKIIEDFASRIEEWPRRYLTTQELNNINNPLFTFGLHGHEHYKYNIMSNLICKNDLEKNIELLSKHSNYIPFFAFPFGYWRSENFELINSLGLTAFFCGGKLNYTKNAAYYRMPISNETMSMKFLAENSGEYTLLNKIYRNARQTN